MAINSLSASSNGLSGLASGLDTESMVEQLLSGTQSKIDSTNQKITQLEYKQELYQGVITDLKNFQNTYFSYTNQESNLLSTSFFSSKTVSSSSKAFSVTASSSASVGSVTVNSVKSLATAYKQTATKKASGELMGAVDQSKLDAWKKLMTDEEKLTIEVGGKSVEIKASDIVGKGNNDVADIVNNALKDKGIDAEAKFLNGKFSITAKDEKAEIKVSGTSEVNSMLGLAEGKSVSGTGSAEMSFDATAAMPSITVDVDGVTKEIKLDLFKDNDGSGTVDVKDIVEQLQKGLTDAFGDGIKVVNSDGTGNNFAIVSTNSSRKITITGDDESLAILGMENKASNKISLTSSVKDAQFATEVKGSQQKFTINGVDFSFSSDTSISSIITQINNSDAGVKVSYSSTTDKFSIESTTTGSRSNAFEISQSEGNLLTAMFGIPDTGSFSGMELTKTGMTEAAVPSDFSFEGGKVNITINGEQAAFDLSDFKPDDAEALVARLNTELSEYLKTKGVTDGSASIKFEIDGGKVALKSSGDIDRTAVTATIDDDSLKALGFDNTVTEKTTLAELGIKNDDVSFIVDGRTIKFDAGEKYTLEDGTELTIDASTTLEDMVKVINHVAGEDVAELKGAPPYIRLCGVELPIQFIDLSGKLTGTTNPVNVGGNAAGAGTTLMTQSGDTATASTKLSDLGITDKISFTINGQINDFTITEGDTLGALINAVNKQAGKDVVSLRDGKLLLADDSVSFKVGDNENALASAIDDTFYVTQGTDAVMEIDGVEVVRSTNSFTIDGLTFNLTGTTDEASTIGVTQDTDKIYDTVMKFVEDYNKLINSINSLLDADATYRDYDPLTTAQEDEMTESQIEKWNEKAKEGLLRNDSTLTSVLSSLRQTLYTKPEGGIALYELGITTSYFGTKDNLTVEDKAAVKAKIAENPDAVMKLFTDTSKGLSTLLNKAIDGAAKSSTTNPGSLVRMAGSKGVTDTSSSIYKQTKELKEKLEKLEDQYETEYDRYWKQFNSMESYISQMNSMSSYLTSSFS